VSNSAIGLFALPIATPLLPWLPKLPIPGLNPLNVMVLGIFLPWALARVLKRQQVFRPSSLGAWLGILVLICAISIVRGAAVPTGYDYNPGNSALWLFRNAMTFVIYFITLSMATGERVRRRLSFAICIGLLFESLVTIRFGQNGSGGRALGTFGQPNELGAFLSMFTVLSASLMLGVQKWYQRIFLLAAMLAGVLATLMTVSRGAVIAVICGLLVVVMRARSLTIVLLWHWHEPDLGARGHEGPHPLHTTTGRGHGRDSARGLGPDPPRHVERASQGRVGAPVRWRRVPRAPVRAAGDRRGDGAQRQGHLAQHVPSHARGAGRVRAAPLLFHLVEVLVARRARREGGAEPVRSPARAGTRRRDARARLVVLVRRSLLLDPDHRQLLDAVCARRRIALERKDEAPVERKGGAVGTNGRCRSRPKE
jgi:hypothetical protein